MGRSVRAIFRNPLHAWPPEIYDQPLVRLRMRGRDIFFVADPALIGTILQERAANFTKGDSMLRALSPALGHGILTADGADWRWQRRAAAPSFRHDQLQRFVPDMLQAATATKIRWQHQQRIDIGHEMMRTTFDIIMRTMLSGDQQNRVDPARVEREITKYLANTRWPIALSMLRAPRWLWHPGRGQSRQSSAWLRAALLQLVADRRQAPAADNDLLDMLLAATDPETGQTMSERELADNLLTFIAAGHETTALALSWTFLLLARHPEHEAAVLEEIAAVTGGGPLQPSHLPSLALTRRVIQEAMRLYPPAGIVVRETQTATQLGPYEAVPGSDVIIPIYAVHRHSQLWDEPERFDPDRFLPDAAKARHRYAYLPFGAGPRICIGASFAMLEAVAILATLLPEFRFHPVSMPEPMLHITLRPAHAPQLTIGRRGA